MAVQLLSFPFRLLPNGRLATVEQDSEAQVSEALAQVVLTRPGERDLVPDFGVNDPTYDTIYQSQIEAQVEEFEIPCTITAVAVNDRDETNQDVTIYFE